MRQYIFNFAVAKQKSMDYIDYDRIYRTYGELGFPHAERTYFDHIGTEFSYNTIERKLLDIGYLLWRGYDVRADIHHTYSDAHPSVSQNDVRQTIYILLAELWEGRTEYVEQMFRHKSMDALIDELFTAVLRYYHLPTNHYQPHYLKDPLDMTEKELRDCNPWREVADLSAGNDFLLSDKHNLVCSDDKEMIETFNASAKPEHKYHLNIPAYPWYGNPLTAKVIVLSLNPGYDERQSKIAAMYKMLPQGLVEGYAIHLRSMLTFDCYSFLPEDFGPHGVTTRDLANIHQGYYWQDRLTSAFVNEDTGLSFEQINDRFAVIQYVGYSSIKYAPLKRGQLLPSQNYTKQLIQFILHNNPDTVFIVPRAVNSWKSLLGSMWKDNRFFVSNLPRSQWFSAATLGEEAYFKIIEAFKR